jgi:hypothetical protein
MEKITRDHLASLPVDRSLRAVTLETAKSLAVMMEVALRTTPGNRPFRSPDWQAEYLGLYYGLRIHGAFGAAVVLFSHTLHREQSSSRGRVTSISSRYCTTATSKTARQRCSRQCLPSS